MSPTTTTAPQPHMLTPPIRRHAHQQRSRKLFWFVLIGIVLLAGSGITAAIMLNEGLLPQVPSKKTAELQPRGVSAQGYVDADPKVADLNPTTPGRIVWLIEEGKPATKGDVLLKIENGAAKKKVEAAKAALAAAQAKLEVAKIGPEQLAILEKQLELSIEVAKQKKVVAGAELDEARRAFGLKQLSAKAVEIAEAAFKGAEAALSAEENKRLELRLRDPQLDIKQADANVAAAQAQLDEANWFLQQHELKAPFDGTVLRVQKTVGEMFTSFEQMPAIQFAPNTPRIVRAEVLQEWSDRVKEGQEVVIEDDTKAGHTWKGRVKKVSDWITQRRVPRMEPFNFNDVRTLESIIELEPDDRPLRIGQRVRVTILTDEKEKVAKASPTPQ